MDKNIFFNKRNEITISLFTENSILLPHQIKTYNHISYLYLKALTNLELASINAKEFENLMIENIEINIKLENLIPLFRNYKYGAMISQSRILTTTIE